MSNQERFPCGCSRPRFSAPGLSDLAVPDFLALQLDGSVRGKLDGELDLLLPVKEAQEPDDELHRLRARLKLAPLVELEILLEPGLVLVLVHRNPLGVFLLELADSLWATQCTRALRVITNYLLFGNITETYIDVASAPTTVISALRSNWNKAGRSNLMKAAFTDPRSVSLYTYLSSL